MAGDSPKLLEVRGLKKHFPVEQGLMRRSVGLVKAVDGVDLFISPGETLGLVGESGCGKTTTGRCILRAIEPTAGQVFMSLDGTRVDITALGKQELYAIRRHAQMIFQDPYSSLDPRMTVLDIISEPLVANGLAHGSELVDRVLQLMKLVGLEAKHLKRYPHAFSGGQRQRIGIARALAPNPRLVIADEPVSALDVSIQAQILNLMQDLQSALKLTYLFVAHDLSVIEHISDRVAVMYVGKMVELAATEELFLNPLHPYTEALLSAVPKPNPDIKMERIILPGEVANPASPPSGCYFHPRCRYAKEICKHEAPVWQEARPGHWVSCHFARELTLRGVTESPALRNAGEPVAQAQPGSASSMPVTGGPLFFRRNRVARVYRGGKLFHGFFGDPAEDGFLPEEWIASSVRALNRDSNNLLEGISLLERDGTPFTAYLEHHPEALGGRADLGILVKILDSSIRLPVQAHPDKPFARRHFNSAHGKTEMWIVLATRGDARIHFGFKGPVSRTEFAAAVAASETDRDAMARLLNSVPARPGDVYLIPPRVVHAIGEGCLILEVQEPTDFTLQPEAWCGDYRLNEFEKYLGLAPEVALECFDFNDLVGAKAVRRGRIDPRVVSSDDTVTVESLISSDVSPDFSVNRYFLRRGTVAVPPGPAVHVVTEGEGTLVSAGGRRGIARGSYFFQPAGAERATMETASTLTVVECLPPALPG